MAKRSSGFVYCVSVTGVTGASVPSSRRISILLVGRIQRVSARARSPWASAFRPPEARGAVSRVSCRRGHRRQCAGQPHWARAASRSESAIASATASCANSVPGGAEARALDPLVVELAHALLGRRPTLPELSITTSARSRFSSIGICDAIRASASSSLRRVACHDALELRLLRCVHDHDEVGGVGAAEVPGGAPRRAAGCRARSRARPRVAVHLRAAAWSPDRPRGG